MRGDLDVHAAVWGGQDGPGSSPSSGSRRDAPAPRGHARSRRAATPRTLAPLVVLALGAVGLPLASVVPASADSAASDAWMQPDDRPAGRALGWDQGRGNPHNPAARTVQFVPPGQAGTVTKAVVRFPAPTASAGAATLYSNKHDRNESGSKPARTSAHDPGEAGAGWLEYDVTGAVTGNGAYSFTLSTDEAGAESPSSWSPPQLVLTVDGGRATTTTPVQDTGGAGASADGGSGGGTGEPSSPYAYDAYGSGGGTTGDGATAPVAAGLPSDPLTWAPPALTNPKTYHVSGDGPGTLTAAAGQDSIVVFDGPVHRRIRMSGGRHWVLRGGEVNNSRAWPNIDDQAGLEFADVDGTAFVEGVLIHGAYGKDGIRVGSGGSDMTLVVQNTRILDRMAGPTGYHADVIQPFGGVKALKVDRLTGHGDYQGQMWKRESGTTFGPTDFRRVNYRAATPQVQYMINFVMSAPTAPVTLAEVFVQPDPRFAGGDFCDAHTPSSEATCATDAAGRKYVTWSGTPIAVHGRVTQGLPSFGDFVPEGVAGIGYVSPGYL